jgi:hypothetical protein
MIKYICVPSSLGRITLIMHEPVGSDNKLSLGSFAVICQSMQCAMLLPITDSALITLLQRTNSHPCPQENTSRMGKASTSKRQVGGEFHQLPGWDCVDRKDVLTVNSLWLQKIAVGFAFINVRNVKDANEMHRSWYLMFLYTNPTHPTRDTHRQASQLQCFHLFCVLWSCFKVQHLSLISLIKHVK